MYQKQNYCIANFHVLKFSINKLTVYCVCICVYRPQQSMIVLRRRIENFTTLSSTIIIISRGLICRKAIGKTCYKYYTHIIIFYNWFDNFSIGHSIDGYWLSYFNRLLKTCVIMTYMKIIIIIVIEPRRIFSTIRYMWEKHATPIGIYIIKRYYVPTRAISLVIPVRIITRCVIRVLTDETFGARHFAVDKRRIPKRAFIRILEFGKLFNTFSA